MQDGKNTNFSERKVLVVGLGVSGLWTARWLAGQKAVVTVSERRPEPDIDTEICGEILRLGITLETGGHRRQTFTNTDLIIVSPGVPDDIEPLRAAKNKGIPVIGELEFACRLIDTPVIAITGTNGKSTVTAFLGFLLENSGFDVFVGGNIGTPLMAYVQENKNADYIVAEISSFQLDTIDTFCPFISVVLNISPDHLDRYVDYEAYVQSKLRIFKNQGHGQYIVLNDDDRRLSAVKISSGPSLLRYGTGKKEGRHAFIENGRIVACLDGDNAYFSSDSFCLPGRHNLENLLPAVLVGRIIGVEPGVIQNTIDQFKGLPDRLERVAEKGGVAFYNDSKATNVDAAVRAIESFDRPLILLAGGRHKGADYGPLVRAARGRVEKAIFMGESKELFAASFDGVLPYYLAEDMEEAVSKAISWAVSGDVVLLAPACSSFDMFSDYSHRGRVFKAAVERSIRG